MGRHRCRIARVLALVLARGLARVLALVLLASTASAQSPGVDGARALEAGQLAEAEQLLVRAKDGSPAKGWAWFDLCLVHYATGAYGRAIDACYRALQQPAAEKRVLAMLEVIRAELAAQHLSLDGAYLPDPTPLWYRPAASVAAAVIGNVEERGATRGTPEAPLPDANTIALLDDATLARLTGRAPRLPYAIPAAPQEYTRGFEVQAKAGVLFYAKDASPFVAGARLEWRRREPGESWYARYFGEYLQAIDGKGGILGTGIGLANGGMYGESAFGLELGASIPWGEDDRRQDVLFPGYQIAVMLDLRLSYRRDLYLGSSHVSLEASVAGGLNIGKLVAGLANLDPCSESDTGTECPDNEDESPDWRSTYAMFQLGIGFGSRSGRPRYDRSEIFAPTGSR